jgi:hypothetical protein
VALFAGAPIAEAATRYAGPSGTGAEPCANQSDPCNIEDAVDGDTVMPGDDVVLLPGTYTLGLGGLFIENISVSGQAGQPRPLIQASSPTGIVMENNEPTATPPSLRDVDILHSSSFTGLVNAGGLVERVTVTSTAASAIACDVHGRSDVDGLIRDSICLQTGGGAAVGVFAGGLVPSRGQLRNVTAVSPGGLGISVHAIDSGPVEIDAVNTIARGAITDVQATDDGSTTATVTLARSNYATESEPGGSTVTDPGTNENQTAPPLFVNAATGDLHQLPASPTVDAGIADPLLGSLDFEGQPRVIGPAPDIGGDEFMPGVPAAPVIANDFTFGRVVRNVKKGIAFLTVNLPGPGQVGLSGKGVATVAGARSALAVGGAGPVKIKVKPKGKTKAKLNQTGKVTVKPKITYTPTGGDPNTQSIKVKLKKTV